MAFSLIKSHTWPFSKSVYPDPFQLDTIMEEENELVNRLQVALDKPNLDIFWVPNTIWELFVLANVDIWRVHPGDIDMELERYADFFDFCMRNLGRPLLKTLRYDLSDEVKRPKIVEFAPIGFQLVSELLLPSYMMLKAFTQKQRNVFFEELKTINRCHFNSETDDEPLCFSFILSAIDAEVRARFRNSVVIFGYINLHAGLDPQLYYSIFSNFLRKHDDNDDTESLFTKGWNCISQSCDINIIALIISKNWLMDPNGNSGLIDTPEMSPYDFIASHDPDTIPSILYSHDPVTSLKVKFLLSESVYPLSTQKQFSLPTSKSASNLRKLIASNNLILSADNVPEQVTMKSSRDNSPIEMDMTNFAPEYRLPRVRSSHEDDAEWVNLEKYLVDER